MTFIVFEVPCCGFARRSAFDLTYGL